jgi:hypothetical protein
MPCEQFKNALVEAAASGAAPQGELRAHLEACASCREAFEEERSLFIAIDSGLHAAVNSDVPPSLLPRVRASLDDAVVARARWFVSWPVLAGAAVSVAIFFAAVALRQSNVPGSPGTPVASNSSKSAKDFPTIPNSSRPFLQPGPSAPPRASVAKNPGPGPASERHIPQPEVLVPRDQEVFLASYAQQWSARKPAPLLAANLGDTTVAPLEVAPIQIDQLDVKPLAEGNSQ